MLKVLNITLNTTLKVVCWLLHIWLLLILCEGTHPPSPPPKHTPSFLSPRKADSQHLLPLRSGEQTVFPGILKKLLKLSQFSQTTDLYTHFRSRSNISVQTLPTAQEGCQNTRRKYSSTASTALPQLSDMLQKWWQPYEPPALLALPLLPTRSDMRLLRKFYFWVLFLSLAMR